MDLDAIEARALGAIPSFRARQEFVAFAREEIPALVAEVRRLRAIEAEVQSMPALWPLLDTFVPEVVDDV